jgi:hypothetical protein
MCHAAEPIWDGIGVAPKGVRLDTAEAIGRQAEAIRRQVVLISEAFRCRDVGQGSQRAVSVSQAAITPRSSSVISTALMTGRAVFTEAYALIPKGVMRDIVTSVLPFWDVTMSRITPFGMRA